MMIEQTPGIPMTREGGLSVVMITYNEEDKVEASLKAIVNLAGLADEILVVDSLSTDRTVEICRAFGAHVISQAFLGFIEQKNFANAQARYDRILSIDADEVVSPELGAAMLHIKANWPADAYEMNRLTRYCGRRWIRHCGWYPDRKVRLFDRRLARWEGRFGLHERIVLAQGAKLMRLSGDLYHYSYDSVEDHEARSRKYAQIAADAMFEQGKNVFVLRPVLSAISMFIRSYLIKLGLMEGSDGWTIAVLAAKSSYWKYSRLRQLNQKVKAG